MQALARSRDGAPGNEVPTVFLLDIGLPQMDGYELARRLRAQPETAHALLIAVTGYGQERDREQTAAAGFDHHLVKPVDLETLHALLAVAAKRTPGGNPGSTPGSTSGSNPTPAPG